jgi:hypothetical protein
MEYRWSDGLGYGRDDIASVRRQGGRDSDHVPTSRHLKEFSYPHPISLPLKKHLCTFAQELRSDLHLCTDSCLHL